MRRRSRKSATSASISLRINIAGYFLMARAAAPDLGGGSLIINTGSVTDLEGSGELLGCLATKGTIHAFAKSRASAGTRHPRERRGQARCGHR
ncbi:short chain dehydrogenase [compost metagenome]